MTTRDEVLQQLADNGEDPRRTRELIEALLREHDQERQHLMALFDEAPVFMTFLEGDDLRITKVNRRVREHTDITTLLGRTARELAELAGGASSVEVLERVYATGEPATVHTLHELGLYATRWFSRSFVPIRGVDGNVRGVLNLTNEITHEVRERAELQRMFALLDEAPVILSVVESPDWRITMANRLTRELMGSSLVGARLRDLVPPDHPSLAALERVYASGRPETYEIVNTPTAGIAGRSFRTTLVPIREPDGTIGRIMSVAVETTEQQHARESLESQARAKDQFLAMLGHELRNPLAPMLTAIQLMELEGTRSPVVDLLERQIRHLTRLVDDLLDIARITRGMIVLHRQNLEIATIVHRALELANPLLDQRGHRVVIDLVRRGLGVSVDPDRLAQVVANLITNAAKYSEPESRIRIIGSRVGDRVLLSVSDDGIGIAPEMLDRVFEPFVQQPQTQELSQGGLGLGLSIVKSLVEAHGGTVTVHSDGIGRGSTFAIELPAIEVRPQAAVARPVPRVATTPLRILVVDDNHEAADILQIALGACGHSIAIAYDGPSALEVAKSHAPQIALVDLGLPVMDGYRLAEILRATYAIPVVAISGYGQDSDRQRTRAAGFAAHLVKPVDLHELADLVSRLCE